MPKSDTTPCFFRNFDNVGILFQITEKNQNKKKQKCEQYEHDIKIPTILFTFDKLNV